MKSKNTTGLKAISAIAKKPEYDALAITKLMKKLNIDIHGLALLLNVTPDNAKLWLSGSVRPCGAAMRIMQIYDTAPGVVRYLVDEGGGTYSR